MYYETAPAGYNRKDLPLHGVKIRVDGEWQKLKYVRFKELMPKFAEQLCDFFIAHTEFRRADAIDSDEDRA
jgi:hypothetical protein